MHCHACGGGSPHQLESRIGEERRARIAHQRDVLAGGEAGQERFGALRFVVLMQRYERLCEPERLEERSRMARILGGNHIGALERLASTLAEVAKVADRRGYDLKLPGHADTGVCVETRRKIGWALRADTIMILR